MSAPAASQLAGPAAGAQEIEIRRVAGALGAELRGVNLGEPLTPEIFGRIKAALDAYQVVFLRGQAMDGAQQLELARRLGTPAVYPALQVLGGDEPLETILDDADHPPKADGWHTDITWIANPPAYGILHAREIPEYGGDTLWASLTAAWEALSAPMQGALEGLAVHHDVDEVFHQKIRDVLGPEAAEKVRAGLRVGVDHPLVIRHPVTGRPVLYAAGYWMKHVVGMNAEESRAILDFVMAHVTQPRFSVRWCWQVGDVAIWDERCTVHHALPDHYPQRRVMRRCTVEGAPPPAAV